MTEKPSGTLRRRWQDDGTWETTHDTLRERMRVTAGREPTPSAAINLIRHRRRRTNASYTGPYITTIFGPGTLATQRRKSLHAFGRSYR